MAATEPWAPRPAGGRCLALGRRGVAAVEVALIAPGLLLFLFGVLGLGLIGFYQSLLDDAARVAARQIQLNTPASHDPAAFIAIVCARFGSLALNCPSTLTYSVQASTASSGFGGLVPEVISAAGGFDDAFFSTSPFSQSSPVLVQVAYPLPFVIPILGTLVTGTGTNSIVAASAIRVEPYN